MDNEPLSVRFARAAAEVLVLMGCFIYGLAIVESHVLDPAPRLADEAFRSFDLPEPSPTPIPGLYEFAVPLRAAPTATPKPIRSVRQKSLPVAVGQRAPRSVVRHISPRAIHGSLKGTATWYCKAGRSRCPTRWPDRAGVLDLYAAAGPGLRHALNHNFGSWRGRHVLVCAKLRCVEVKLVDWCACGGDHVIDLFWDAFHYLNPRATGGIHVAIDVR